MPIYTSKSDAREAFGFLEESQPSFDVWARGARAQVAEGFSNTSVVLAGSAIERAGATGEVMSKKDAQDKAEELGVEIGGIGKDGIRSGAFNVLVRRQRAKQKRDRLRRAAEIGGVQSFALQFVGGVADPINLIPFGVGTTAAKASITTSLIAGAKVGVVSTAAFEPAFFALSRFAGDDYGMLDSMVNIAVGGALGSGFHTAGVAVGSLIERKILGPRALEQAILGETIDVSDGDFDASRAGFTGPRVIQDAELDVAVASREARQAHDAATAPVPIGKPRITVEVRKLADAINEEGGLSKNLNDRYIGLTPEEQSGLNMLMRQGAPSEVAARTPKPQPAPETKMGRETLDAARKVEVKKQEADIPIQESPALSEATRLADEEEAILRDSLPEDSPLFDDLDAENISLREDLDNIDNFSKTVDAATRCARSKGGPK